jgi:hypothetical protein
LEQKYLTLLARATPPLKEGIGKGNEKFGLDSNSTERLRQLEPDVLRHACHTNAQVEASLPQATILIRLRTRADSDWAPSHANRLHPPCVASAHTRDLLQADILCLPRRQIVRYLTCLSNPDETSGYIASRNSSSLDIQGMPAYNSRDAATQMDGRR